MSRLYLTRSDLEGMSPAQRRRRQSTIAAYVRAAGAWHRTTYHPGRDALGRFITEGKTA